MSEMSAPYAGWKITSQQEGREQNAAGDFEQGVTVRFQTIGGHTGSVFIPNTVYSAEQVRMRVGARAQLMDQIGELNPGNIGL